MEPACMGERPDSGAGKRYSGRVWQLAPQNLPPKTAEPTAGSTLLLQRLHQRPSRRQLSDPAKLHHDYGTRGEIQQSEGRPTAIGTCSTKTGIHKVAFFVGFPVFCFGTPGLCPHTPGEPLESVGQLWLQVPNPRLSLRRGSRRAIHHLQLFFPYSSHLFFSSLLHNISRGVV